MVYDTIIIGGGISGLYMNLELSKKREKTLLLESSCRFGGRIYQYTENDVSIPAGAARFNRNHKRVISILKEFGLLDFRKDSGISSDIDFIDSKNEFSAKFKGKTGFEYIKKVLNKASKIRNKDVLNHFTFREYAERCLPKDEVEFLLVASGYSGQLKNMNMNNAYHLFQTGIRDDVTFYAGYFHTLVDCIVNYLKQSKHKLLLNSHVKDVWYDEIERNYHINYNNVLRKSKRVVFAIPQYALLRMKVLKPLHHLLEKSIHCKSLCRVYAKFNVDDIWFQNIQKTVTNNQLRYIIPIDRDSGMIMISYTDDIYCEYWKKRQKNQQVLKKSIVDLVRKTFKIRINEPEKVWVFHWECGVGYWNKNVNSKEVSNFVANPMNDLYICGENYSMDQSWVEGALESCERVLSKW